MVAGYDQNGNKVTPDVSASAFFGVGPDFVTGDFLADPRGATTIKVRSAGSSQFSIIIHLTKVVGGFYTAIGCGWGVC